ncbi:hypothetical protein EV175_002629 [Coemansia sp. RSA 1933]|nr:hypothetical protein EV175_002629 [Coemansia sp. RSA 1933]
MSLVEVSHYTVQLFGTTKYDGLRISVFHVRTEGATIDAATMLKLSEQSTYQHNMFIQPAEQVEDRTEHTLRCFSRTSEIVIPPFWAFGASSLVSRSRVVRLIEGPRIVDLPATNGKGGYIQRATVTLESPHPRHGAADTLVYERIIVTNILGRPSSPTHYWPGVQVDYIGRTMVVYHSKMAPNALQLLKPTVASLTQVAAIGQLDIDTVVVCVPHKSTGGLFVRAFLPSVAYTEALMPVVAISSLRHPWSPVLGVFEISWMFDGKPCRMIKATRADNVDLMARAEETLVRTVYV